MNQVIENDHLPPPIRVSDRAPEAIGTSRPRGASWHARVDRGLFGLGGILVGFVLAWLYLQKAPAHTERAASGDPHAGLTGVGGGAPSIPNPMVRQTIRELEEAVARAPRNYDLLVALGNASYDAGEWRQAADAYERALEVKDGDPNVLTDLGVAYRSLGSFDKAIELFGRASKADPKHWPALFNLAIVYGLDKGDITRAKAILTKLKAEHPAVPSLDQLERTLDGQGASAR